MKTPRVDNTLPIAQSTPLQRNSFSSSGSQRSTASSVRSLSDKMSEPSSPYRTPESYWYKPNISREDTVRLLKESKSGDFIVRDSNSYRCCYGLAVRVEKHQIPKSIFDNLKPGTDPSNELVRHFLIEGSPKGVKVSGCDREPYFPSLAALIHQHSHTPLALPVKLNIPIHDRLASSNDGTISSTQKELRDAGAARSIFFLHETDTEMLTGDAAIIRSTAEYFSSPDGNSKPDCLVHFKVSTDGVTLTDSQRKRFFRKHFPTETVSHCGFDPHGTTIKINGSKCRIFGIVAKRSSSNLCVIFAEKDPHQPATDIIQSVNKVMLQSSIVSDFNGTY
jgi:tensin